MLFMIEGDKRTCGTCTLAPLCPSADVGSECTVENPHQGVWTEYFASGEVEDLEIGLGHLLKLQADRIQGRMKRLAEMPEDTDAKVLEEMDERIAKDMDKLYKNGMSLRNAKSPRALSARAQKAQEQPALPTVPTNQMWVTALDAIEATKHIARENISQAEARKWMVDNGLLAPTNVIQGQIEGKF